MGCIATSLNRIVTAFLAGLLLSAAALAQGVDSEEVDRLLGLCEQAKSSSATATFRQVFGQLSQAQPQRARRSSAAVDQRLEEHHV